MRKMKGFTLIELIILMLIMTLIAALVLPAVQKTIQNQDREISELRGEVTKAKRKGCR